MSEREGGREEKARDTEISTYQDRAAILVPKMLRGPSKVSHNRSLLKPPVDTERLMN